MTSEPLRTSIFWSCAMRRTRPGAGLGVGDHLGVGDVGRLGHALVCPLDDRVAFEDALTVLHEDLVALAYLDVREDLARVEGALAGEEGAAFRHLDEGTRDVGDEDRVLEVNPVLLRHLRRRATDMEGAHRKLRSRLADGLGGDDAHRLADLHRAAGREVAAVALAAHPVLGLAGKDRPQRDFLDPRLVYPVGDLLGDLLVRGDDEVSRDGVADGIEGVASHDALAESLDDLLAVLYGSMDRAVYGAAVVLVDDDVLRYVDEAPREVSGIGRLEGGIGEALPRAVRRDEELDDRQALAEIGADGQLDDVARRLCHEAAHARELPYLVAASARARVGHHVDVVEACPVALEGLHHHRGQFLVRLGPDLHDSVIALFLRDVAGEVLLLDGVDLGVGGLDHLGLLGGHDDIVHPDGGAEESRVAEAVILDLVEHLHGDVWAFLLVDRLDEGPELLVAHLEVDVGHLGRKGLVEEDASRGRIEEGVRPDLDRLAHAVPDRPLRDRHLDDGLVVAGLRLAGHEQFLWRGEAPALALDSRFVAREEVDAQDHVLRGEDDGLAVRGVEEVSAREHEGPALGLSGAGERHVDRHLVAVEVRVVGVADERVKLDGLTLDEDGLECLDAEAVKSRRAVEEDRMLLDYFVEDGEDLGGLRLDEHLRLLDVVDHVLLDELLHDEGLEELEGHLGREPALPHLELGPDDDDGAAGVVDALAEEVLAEPTLLALEHVGEGLERPVRRRP